MNVNISVRDFNYGYKRGTRFRKKMIENKRGRKRTGLHLGNNLLSCKQLNLYCTFSQFLKSTFLIHILCFKYQKAVCVT